MMITKGYVIINSETGKPYAQRDEFIEAIDVAVRKINGRVITRADYEKMQQGKLGKNLF